MNIDNLVIDTAGAYTRSYSDTREALINALNDAYTTDKTSVQGVVVTSSGMNAIFLLVNALTKCHEEIIVFYPNEVYCDVPKTFDYMTNTHAYSYRVGDHTELMRLLSLPSAHQKVLFVESASNPNSISF